MYLKHFLAVKKKTHALYKFVRPMSADELMQDVAKYKTNSDMAYVPPMGVFNEEHKRKIHRNMADLQLGVDLGSLEEPNKELRFVPS